MKFFRQLFSLAIIPLAIVILAGGFVAFLIKTKPKPKKSERHELLPKVEIITQKAQTNTPWIESFGTVRSYYETDLASLVSGEVIWVSPRFQAGESIQKGEPLVKLNTADYITQIAQQMAAIANAKNTLIAEQARARVARHDWQSSGRKLSDASDYSLRIPQQAAAKASLQFAQAALDKAKLDLKRCTITSPYDAIVIQRHINPGGVIQMGANIGKIVSRQKAEVRLSLSPKEVTQLNLPLAFKQPNAHNGSLEKETNKKHLDVHLTSPAYPKAHWEGKITRTEINIDPKNQVVYIVAEIDHPFDSNQPGQPPLPIGTFVKASMRGNPITNSYILPESAIIDDQYVWVVTHDSTLKRQPITRLYSTRGIVIVRLRPETKNSNTNKQLQFCIRPLPSFRRGQHVIPISTDFHKKISPDNTNKKLPTPALKNDGNEQNPSATPPLSSTDKNSLPS